MLGSKVMAIVARILPVAVVLATSAVAQQHERTPPPDINAVRKTERVVTRWEDLSVVRSDNQLFLQSSSGGRTHLYTDKKERGFVAATFLDKTHIYLETSSHGVFVSDLGGAVLYKLPRFKYADVVPNRLGTRFAVFERGRSAWHEFGQESYDRLRLLAYSTADGKRLFERKWSQAANENVEKENIELSDDGQTLFLHGQSGTQTFSVPGPH